MEGTAVLPAAARRLEGKVAVITGGASGIGESAARLFCRHGAKVVIADAQEELGRAVCEELGPAAAVFVRCDVTVEADVAAAVDTAVAMHGRLDIMFNNAGIAGTTQMGISQTDKATFEKVLAVNVVGVYLGIKHAARVMVPARRGCIINSSSVASCVGGAGPYAYTASKHAVVGLTKSAAVELGEAGIRVNAVSPYGVRTRLVKGFHDMGDEAFDGIMGTCVALQGVSLKASDVADAALFLASDEAKYVSGHNLMVDGGFSVFNPAFNTLVKAAP